MKLEIVLSEDASGESRIRKGGDALVGHLDVQTDTLAHFDIKITFTGQRDICRSRLWLVR